MKIKDKYFEYPQAIYKHLTKLRDKIKSSKDLKKFSKEIKTIEKEITLFHAKAVKQILKKTREYLCAVLQDLSENSIDQRKVSV